MSTKKSMLTIAPRLTASLCALMLSGCIATQSIPEPVGAPEPTNSQMIFVDEDGCRWWVIGNATQRSWAPQTGTDARQICNEAAALAGEPIPQPPVVAPAAAPVAMPVAAAPVPALAPPEPETAPFVVQVATFASGENASAAQANFAAQGLAVASDISTPNRDGFYRLELGPFASSAAAEDALVRARAEGFSDAFVKRR